LIPKQIQNLYIYFLYKDKRSREAFDKFYNIDGSRRFVRRYATRGKTFYAEYMSRYSQEVREMSSVPFKGVITSRGIFK